VLLSLPSLGGCHVVEGKAWNLENASFALCLTDFFQSARDWSRSGCRRLKEGRSGLEEVGGDALALLPIPGGAQSHGWGTGQRAAVGTQPIAMLGAGRSLWSPPPQPCYDSVNSAALMLVAVVRCGVSLHCMHEGLSVACCGAAAGPSHPHTADLSSPHAVFWFTLSFCFRSGGGVYSKQVVPRG